MFDRILTLKGNEHILQKPLYLSTFCKTLKSEVLASSSPRPIALSPFSEPRSGTEEKDKYQV